MQRVSGKGDRTRRESAALTGKLHEADTVACAAVMRVAGDGKLAVSDRDWAVKDAVLATGARDEAFHRARVLVVIFAEVLNGDSLLV